MFKKYGYLILSIIFLAGFVILVLDPFRLSPYSYSALTDRQEEIEALKTTYSSTLREIPSSEHELERKKREADTVRAYYGDIIDIEQLKEVPFHLPSLLILLENESRKHNLEFQLFYELIEPSDLIGGSIKKPGPEPERAAAEKTGSSFSLADHITRTVSGHSSSPYLSTAAVPVTVEGSFEEVCGYIKYLDTAGWLIPSAVKITGSDPVKCEIIIKVYYTAKGGF